MTISNTTIIDQVNTKLAGHASLNNQSKCYLTTAADFINKATVKSVYALTDLPSAAENTGRIIYITSLDDHRYSNGTEWTKQSSSAPVIYNQVWTWGCNLSGQLGDNTVVSKSSPVSVVGGFTNWCQVSTNQTHTAAVRTNGTLWTWGNNTCGRLGDNTVVSKSSPVSVVGGFTDWCQVSAGFSHTAAIRTNRTLWTWGDASQGRLGDNTIIAKSSPVSVVGGFTDWCGVSAGREHNAAVRTNGTLWTWGSNIYGRLGDNTTVNKSSPVSVVGGFTDWCQVSVGYQHTAAVRTNGTLWTWGASSFGQLGDNTIVAKSSPVSIVGGFTDWLSVSTGRFHTAAVRTGGTLWTWGSNNCGQLGDNTTVSKSSPVSVVGGFTDWCQISASAYHNAAIRTNGTLWTWGRNDSGRLGDNTAISRSSPVSVVGGFTDWCQVSAGGDNTAAIRMNKIYGFNE